MAEWFVAKAAEMADGDRRIVTAGRHEIGVFFKDGAFHAYSNHCLHAGGPVCEGLMINRVVDLIGPTAPISARRSATRCISSVRGTAGNTTSRPANAPATASSSCATTMWFAAAKTSSS